MPVFYECQRCTACCRWPGDVRVSDDETARIAAFLQLPEDQFIQRYTKLRRDRKGLSLVEKANGECVFLEEGLCAIQAVKPQQCRDFPNLWRFPGFETKCHAKAYTLDFESYVERVAGATGRTKEYVRSHPHSD